MKRRRLEFSDYYDELIVNEICEIYDVEKERMFLGNRQRNIIQAKRLYIYILREMFALSLSEIAGVMITETLISTIEKRYQQLGGVLPVKQTDIDEKRGVGWKQL